METEKRPVNRNRSPSYASLRRLVKPTSKVPKEKKEPPPLKLEVQDPKIDPSIDPLYKITPSKFANRRGNLNLPEWGRSSSVSKKLGRLSYGDKGLNRTDPTDSSHHRKVRRMSADYRAKRVELLLDPQSGLSSSLSVPISTDIYSLENETDQPQRKPGVTINCPRSTSEPEPTELSHLKTNFSKKNRHELFPEGAGTTPQVLVVIPQALVMDDMDDFAGKSCFPIKLGRDREEGNGVSATAGDGESDGPQQKTSFTKKLRRLSADFKRSGATLVHRQEEPPVPSSFTPPVPAEELPPPAASAVMTGNSNSVNLRRLSTGEKPRRQRLQRTEKDEKEGKDVKTGEGGKRRTGSADAPRPIRSKSTSNMRSRIVRMDPKQEENFSVIREKRRSGGARRETMIRPPGSSPFDVIPTAPDSRSTYSSESKRFCVATADSKGRRVTMEDALLCLSSFAGKSDHGLYGVFDGHHGVDARDFVVNEIPKVLAEMLEHQNPVDALRQAFTETNSRLRLANLQGGTTALLALCGPENIYIANAGDCRALLCHKGTVRCITKDHRPSDLTEMKRITDRGGKIITRFSKGKSISRIQNGSGVSLGVSRSFGDFELGPLIWPTPDVFTIPLLQENDFLVLACDGLFDILDNDEVVEIATDQLTINRGNLQKAAIRLRDVAFHRNGEDNISVMLIQTKV